MDVCPMADVVLITAVNHICHCLPQEWHLIKIVRMLQIKYHLKPCSRSSLNMLD